jgi:hypothetical protein
MLGLDRPERRPGFGRHHRDIFVKTLWTGFYGYSQRIGRSGSHDDDHHGISTLMPFTPA